MSHLFMILLFRMDLLYKYCSLHWMTIHMIFLLCLKCLALGQIRYSIVEELERGTPVGNLVQDLQVDLRSLFNRKFQMTYDTKIQYFDLSSQNGTLYISNKIDREELCGSSVVCEIKLGIVMDMPLELYHIEIQILDINDNSPVFPEMETVLRIAESIPPGTHFPLEGAFDPDINSNSVCMYYLNPNYFFGIETNLRDFGSKSLALVLKNALDREKQTSHQLALTAADCGSPKRFGATQIVIEVQDANDNHPIFQKSLYRVSIPENSPLRSLVVVVTATDLDEGANSEIEYSFSNVVPLIIKQIFQIDKVNGEVKLVGYLDYEERTTYEIQVQAKDNGQLVMTGHCKVMVSVTDVNDNAPEIKVTSLSRFMREDTEPGFVVALFTVTDRDSGFNGQVSCEIPDKLPFNLVSRFSNYYSVILRSTLDREVMAQYQITIFAVDAGLPFLSTTTNIIIMVSDVNDNPPVFSKISYTLSVPENMVPGSLIFQVSALDKDSGVNAQIGYFLKKTSMGDLSVSNYFSINPDSGKIFTLNSLDYESTRMVYILIEARDYGSPSLSSTANVTIFIQDQNDNSPHISSVLPSEEVIWRSAKVEHMVTKITAVDPDSGYNAWLSYELDPLTNTTLFRIGLYTGEIRLARTIDDTDEQKHRLVIVVKDHGNPPKSAIATVTITIHETSAEATDDYTLLVQSENKNPYFNFYLTIAISFISSIILFIAIFYTGFKYLRSFGNTYRWKETEELEYVRNDWTILDRQKCDVNFTPLYFNTIPYYKTATTAQSSLDETANGEPTGELMSGYNEQEAKRSESQVIS